MGMAGHTAPVRLGPIASSGRLGGKTVCGLNCLSARARESGIGCIDTVTIISGSYLVKSGARGRARESCLLY